MRTASLAPAFAVLTLSASAFGLVGEYPGSADLVYNPSTGNITIVPNGASITGFNLQAAGGETIFAGGAAASFPSGAFGAPIDNDTRIAWTTTTTPFTSDFNIGNVAQLGLTSAQLLSIFDGAAGTAAETRYNISGTGTRQHFDLVVIPEPTTLGLLGMTSLVGLRRRRG